MNNVLITVLVALVLFSGYVNIKVLRSRSYSWIQKLVQSLIIWCVPWFGGLIVNYFANESNLLPPKSFADGNSGNDGIVGGGDYTGGDGGGGD